MDFNYSHYVFSSGKVKKIFLLFYLQKIKKGTWISRRNLRPYNIEQSYLIDLNWFMNTVIVYI
jgi:hypothetical protein